MNKASSSTSAGSRVLRNFALQLGGEFGGQAVAFIIAIYLARVLDPHGFGVWVFASSILLYCTVIIDGGTDVWGMREIAARPGRLKRLAAAIFRSRLLLGIPAAVVVVAFLIVGSRDEHTALLLGLPILLAFMFNTAWAHRGLETGLTGPAVLIQRLAMLVLVYALVTSTADAEYVTLWQAIAESLGMVILLLALLPRFRKAHRASARIATRYVFAHSWPLAAVKAMRSMTAISAIVALNFASTKVEVGYYGAALRMATILVLTSTVFINVAFPALSRACRRAGQARVIDASVRLLFSVTAPIAVGGIVLAGPLIRDVMSPEFAKASTMLAILFGGHFAMAISDQLRRILAARHMQRLDFKLTCVATLFAVVCTILLASSYGGVGAAIALLSGEALLVALSLWGVARTGPAVAILRDSARPLAGAAVMGAAVLLTAGTPLLTRLAVGVGVYLCWAWLNRRQLQNDVKLIST